MGSPDGDTFVTTRWTRVVAAHGDSESSRAALGELCAAYYAPVVAFLTHAGCGESDPREVAHEFFAGILSAGRIGGVDPGRGRFRTYLLGALKHHLANRRRDSMRQRRGGSSVHVALDGGVDSNPEAGDPALATPPPADAVFDREWAVAVTERALAVLRHEATAGGQSAQYSVLKAWLSADADPGSQSAAARQLGVTEGAVKVAIHRWRKRFRGLVRAEVAQTLSADGDLPGELRYLVDALS